MGNVRLQRWVQSALAAAAALALAAAPAEANPKHPAPGQIHVITTPAGAMVSCDRNPPDLSPVAFTNLPPGEHLIVVTKSGYQEGRRTAVINPGQRLPLDITLAPLTGLALIHTDPPGAEVLIDDAERGQTPLLVTDLPLGSYRVRLRAAGYAPKEIALDLKDRIPVLKTVDLMSDAAQLEITSDPTGATVVVNGSTVGVTPHTLSRLPAGESAVEVSLAGYQTERRSIRLAPGQQEHLHLALIQQPAQVRVVSIPEKARIYVNNQFRGESPIDIAALPPGEHRLRAELAGYDPMARTITLKRGDSVVEEFRMDRNAGTVELTTEPPGVRVFVDGKAAGETRAPGADLVSQPLRLDLAPGAHQIRLLKRGFATEEFSVDVAKNGETRVPLKRMKKQFVPNYEVQTPSGTEQGVLVEIDGSGNIKLETRPGIFKTIPKKDVRSSAPIP